MKAKLERDALGQAVAWASKFAKGTMTSLNMVKVTAADDGTLALRATDLQTTADIIISASVDESGEVLLPAKLLANLVSKLPDEPVLLSSDGGKLTISCGRSKMGLLTKPTDDFPTIEAAADDAATVELTVEQLSGVAARVAPAAAKDDSRPTLTGVRVAFADSTVTAAATDSYRLARFTSEYGGSDHDGALIPASALVEASKAASGETVQVTTDSKRVVFDLGGGRKLTSQLIEGAFPDPTTLLPSEFAATVTVDRDTLEDILGRVSVMAATQNNVPVTLSVTGGDDPQMTVGCRANEVGDAGEPVAVNVDGNLPDDPFVIGFNPVYLLAGLDALNAPMAQLEINGSGKPVVLHGGNRAEFAYLLMPQRLPGS